MAAPCHRPHLHHRPVAHRKCLAVKRHRQLGVGWDPGEHIPDTDLLIHAINVHDSVLDRHLAHEGRRVLNAHAAPFSRQRAGRAGREAFGADVDHSLARHRG